MNVASFIRIFAAVAWMAFIGLIVITVLRASRNKNVKGVVTIVLIVLAAALVLSTVSAGIVFIQPEERGVVISALQSGGVCPEPLQPGLKLVNFILRNITFSPEYAASVGQKQVAEQQAQQAAFVVEQRRQEAEQARQVAQGQADAVVINAQGAADARIIQAQAEAQALQLIAAALQNNDNLLLYQYINQLAPGIQVMLVPNDNPYLLTLPTLPSATPTATQLPTTTP